MKYGGFAAVMTVIAAIGVILLNLIVQQFSPQIDLTKNKLFSLSEQSLNVAQSVASPVAIYGVWEPSGEHTQAKEIAERYAAKNKLIRFEAVDPDLNPGLLKPFDKDGKGIPKGSLIVSGEKGFKVIVPQDMYDVYYNQQQQPQLTGVAIEKRITSALLFAGAGETPKLYEITGHQEGSLAFLQKTFEQENYRIQQINLLNSAVPDDANAVILNNPITPLAREETEKLFAYLEKGGRLIVLLDYRSGGAESVNEVLANWGAAFRYGITAELDPDYRIAGRSPFELLPNLIAHPIADSLIASKTPALMPLPMGVSETPVKRRTIKTVPFLSSSRNSFLRSDLQNAAQEQSPGDTPGPVTLGLAVLDPEYPEQNAPQTRIVLFGDALFLELSSQIPGNLDLFMNALAWTADRPENLSVGSRSTFTMRLRMNLTEGLIIGILFVIVIPLICFLLGLITWLKRRHL
ncbi:MAG: GldG family protein [Spirochaetaceae bacterium]|nr:GldG family protein [Spirochaetaceae bacterium]